MNIDLDQFRGVFLDEASEHLSALERGLVRLEEGDADVGSLLDEIFRSAHSIKGGAGTFGLDEVSRLTHSMESVLDVLRDEKRAPTSAQADLLLSAVDHLRDLLDGEPGGDWEETSRALVATIATGPTPSESSEGEGPAEAVVSGGFRIRFWPDRDFFLAGADVWPLIRELHTLGEVEASCDVRDLPPLAELDPEKTWLGWDIVIRGEVSREDLFEVFEFYEDDCELEIEPLLAEPVTGSAEAGETTETADAPAVETTSPPPTPSGSARSGARREGGSIRVDTMKVDELVDLAGELVVAHARVSELVDRFSIDQLEELRQAVATLSRSTHDLQEQVMRVRMLPLAHLFSRFPRLIRDLANSLGKKIRLEVEGEETELDKGVIEQLGDPLTHLLRNCADHGIESPELRRDAGKEEEGVIHISASHRGGSVELEIRDDGAGLDTQRIHAKAVESGLVGPDDDLADAQIHNLIFRPGFSTAEAVSDLSGRGVGMDVVRRNVEGFNGSITVDSVRGEGSSFRIRVPLTLAILDGQRLRVGDQTFIIPLLSVVESFQPAPEQVKRIQGRADVLLFRGQTTPLVNLADLFEVAPRRSTEPGSNRRVVVVVETERGLLALGVDELLSQSAVVIKNLEANYRKIPGIMGATILGDGRVGLILDVNEVDALRRRDRGAPVAASPSAAVDRNATYGVPTPTPELQPSTIP